MDDYYYSDDDDHDHLGRGRRKMTEWRWWTRNDEYRDPPDTDDDGMIDGCGCYYHQHHTWRWFAGTVVVGTTRLGRFHIPIVESVPRVVAMCERVRSIASAAAACELRVS